jgi:hypothetical protein
VNYEAYWKSVEHSNKLQFESDDYGKCAEKSLDSSPDETRTFEKGKIELANLGEVTIGRATLEPGWSWEKCVKPLVKTDSYQAPHTQYIISGRIKVVMDDGADEKFDPGDAAVIPSGNNAWVDGDEPAVGIYFTALKEYAKPRSSQKVNFNIPAFLTS